MVRHASLTTEREPDRELVLDVATTLAAAGRVGGGSRSDRALTRLHLPRLQNPCKHIAAVLYVFADQLDADPWLLMAWRGRTREEIVEPLRGSTAPPVMRSRRGGPFLQG